MRLQLARAQSALLTPEEYDQFFIIHGMTMIFWYAAPILSGFANYFIPLLIGARDMAFPSLNAVSYWSYLFSGLRKIRTNVLFGRLRAGPYNGG
jgi:cytochrome c oxidase subunit I+III